MRTPRSGGSGWVLGMLGAGALALAGIGSGAEEASGGTAPAEQPAPPSVGLDALLRLPSDAGPDAGRDPKSAERQHWEERFAAVRAELESARAKLAAAQAELEGIARKSESWQMAAPGAQHNPETSPLSFKLRADIRGHREDIARAERRLRELEVEASLAGVPPEWRRPPHEDASPDS